MPSPFSSAATTVESIRSVGPSGAPALVEQPFVPDPLGELRRIAADDGIDLHDLAPGNGEWVVRVVDAKIVEWGRKIEPA